MADSILDMTEYGCKAVVTVTLEIQSSGHWGGNATVAEVQRIGGRETLNALTTALTQGKLDYKIVGEPKIGAVTWANKS